MSGKLIVQFEAIYPDGRTTRNFAGGTTGLDTLWPVLNAFIRAHPSAMVQVHHQFEDVPQCTCDFCTPRSAK